MAQVFSVLGVACAVCVVLLSLGMHWYVKKRADIEPERAGQVVLRGSLARTLLCVLAAAFFLLSSVIG